MTQPDGQEMQEEIKKKLEKRRIERRAFRNSRIVQSGRSTTEPHPHN
jgi:hypothetical protein